MSEKPYPLELHVPTLGKISAVKMGEMEREYLLISGATVSWVSHSDIKAILGLNNQSNKEKSL